VAAAVVVVWEVLGAAEEFVGAVSCVLAAARALVRGGDGTSDGVSVGSVSITVSCWLRVRLSFVILLLNCASFLPSSTSSSVQDTTAAPACQIPSSPA
jgi:hypothetical protein